MKGHIAAVLASGGVLDFLSWAGPRYGELAALALDLHLVRLRDAAPRNAGELRVVRSARRKVAAWLESQRRPRTGLMVIEGGRR